MKRVLALSLAVFAFLIIGCAYKPAPMPSSGAVPMAYEGERGSRASEDLGTAGQGEQEFDARMVISSARLRLEVAQQDTVHAKVIKLAGKYKGYVLSSGDMETAIRIPSINFYDAIAEIETYGKVVAKDITGQDITDEYRDLNVRLDNAEKTRQRYLALLDRANNVSDMLKIEAELERINVQIETMKGKLERLHHLVEYSTITVNTSKEIRPGPIGYVFYGLYKGLTWLMVWK